MVRNDDRVWILHHLLQEPMGPLSHCRITQRVRHLHQNPRRSDQSASQRLRGLDGGAMKTIGGIQQGEIVEGVGEHFRHHNGFPWA